MASYNRVVIMGNVTRDIDLRYTQGGTAVCEVGMAINERVKKNDEWVDDVVFVNVTMWGRTAEVASEYLAKGSPVLVEGRLKLDQWERDGQKHSRLSVVADKMQLLGSKNDGSGAGRSGGQQSGGQRSGSQRSASQQSSGPKPQGRAEGFNAYGKGSAEPQGEYEVPF